MTLNYTKTALVSLLAIPLFGLALMASAADIPEWDTTGNYVVNMNYLG
jgi:hypothetical protein